MLDFRIHTFLTVCDCMNFTKAAEQLHITQPAVSQHIHYLEQEYQTKLFLHDGKKLSLSPAGELLFKAASAISSDAAILKEKLQSAVSDQIPFHFGVTRTIGDFMIAAPLCEYQKTHPDTEIHMIISNTDTLLDRLRSGEINFALVEGHFKCSDYSCRPFSTEDFIAVCSGQHQFTHKPACLSNLTNETLILREKGSGTRTILERHLESQNLHLSDFKKITEIGSVHSIIDFVKADCGITFLYKIAVKKELDSGVLTEIQLSDFCVQHNFTFIWNKDSMFSSYYDEICNELQHFHQLF